MEQQASPKLLCLPDVWLHIPEGARRHSSRLYGAD